MSLNTTPRGNRFHIALFGRRNAGKSSVINTLTDQDIAIVSPIRGTTTDPVYKPMELLPMGPVVIIDTAGLDDTGDLGALRKEKTLSVLDKTDLALVVIDGHLGLTKDDKEIIEQIEKKNIPQILLINKCDKSPISKKQIAHYDKWFSGPVLSVSAKTNEGFDKLKVLLGKMAPKNDSQFRLIGDLLSPDDVVILVTPIDSSAPKGRLILPQQQTIRDILESDAVSLITKETELSYALNRLKDPPRLIVTDSQAFEFVNKNTPTDVMLTSFSILFARQKGDLNTFVQGAYIINKLKDGAHILIAEACTHHRQSDDIGRVKIPKWLSDFTGKSLNFSFSSGTQFSSALPKYDLIVHCGACMLNASAMDFRIQSAKSLGIPIVNYGILIAHVNGILERALCPFPSAKNLWKSLNS